MTLDSVENSIWEDQKQKLLQIGQDLVPLLRRYLSEDIEETNLLRHDLIDLCSEIFTDRDALEEFGFNPWGFEKMAIQTEPIIEIYEHLGL